MGDSEWSDWKTWRSEAKPLSFQFQASTANSKLVVDNDNMWVCFPDGNTGAIMGRVARALRKGGVSHDEVDAYRKQTLSGDYAHVLDTAARWVEVT